MTDKTGETRLTPIQERFVVAWGEMGTKWGINRTVAQIHALLFLSSRPLNAEEIAATLGVARSNVSTSLRELQGWGIVRVAHILGDRRDHFESMKDDPVLAMLRDTAAEAKKPGAADAYTRERLADMLQFFELMIAWAEQTRKLPTAALMRLAKMGDKLGRLLG
jgi:hypothetical protein